MNDTPDNSTPENQALPSEILLELNFVPTWAREEPGRKSFSHYDGDSARPDRRRGGRNDRGPYHDHARSPRKQGRPSGSTADKRGTRSTRERRPGSQPRIEREHEFTERPTVKISFIPEQKNLGVIVRKIRSSSRAYPLFDIAGLFMREPKSCLVVMEAMPRSEGEKTMPLFQCKECKNIFLRHEELTNHALRAHMDKFYRVDEIAVDPPAGNYPMVARCTLSGILLGPPNYHGYQELLQEIYQSRFSHMPLEEYQKRIEILRDPEMVEKWKQDVSKRTVYRVINQENAPDMKKADAEHEFLEKYAPAMVKEVYRVIINSAVALNLENTFLKNLLNRIYEKEQQHPFTMAMALRSAFRHMDLQFFKTKGNATFVTAVKPRPLDTEHIVESLGEVLKFLHDNPGCTRKDMVTKLWPDASDQEITAHLSPLTWLIEKGHVIEFFNGTLAVPLNRGREKKARGTGGRQ